MFALNMWFLDDKLRSCTLVVTLKCTNIITTRSIFDEFNTFNRSISKPLTFQGPIVNAFGNYNDLRLKC